MTLDNVTRGQRIRILSIASSAIRSQVIRFGLGVGETAVCQETLPKGPVVLRKNRQEIAIGRGLTTSIEVEIVSA